MKSTLKQFDKYLELSLISNIPHEKQMLEMAHATVVEFGEQVPIEFKVERVKKKRTLDQNAFMWKLLGEWAKFTNSRINNQDIEYLYIEQLKKHCLPEKLLLKETAVETFVRHLQPRYYAIKGYTTGADKQKYVYIDLWVGSSNFDTKEMAQLMNGILDDMEVSGVDTMQFIKMTKEWKEYEKHIENK